MNRHQLQLFTIREVMARFEPVPSVKPNEKITTDRVFTPGGHRAVLDLGRQLVVGNRGMGKSLWTHALLDEDVRRQVARTYRQPALEKAKVAIGFNGSDKSLDVAPTPAAIERALSNGFSADEVWRAVIYRAALKAVDDPEPLRLSEALQRLRSCEDEFEDRLTEIDDELVRRGKSLLILFDALDRVAGNWRDIRLLTTSLLKRALGLRSFQALRTKIFIRPDQFADPAIFMFPDGSKLKSEHVDLSWQPHELYALLFFEICRTDSAARAFNDLCDEMGISRTDTLRWHPDSQKAIVDTLAGPYMGSDARRGRVYTWVPLHLSDARNACSPRTFLIAWRKAAEHDPQPIDVAVNHLGLIEGVRRASSARLEELREDYRWIDDALSALRGQFVPIERDELLNIWQKSQVVSDILIKSSRNKWLAPVELDLDQSGNPRALLEAMSSIAVMEERSNGKINVPDIFRVEAGIMRRGGVAVPRRNRL